MNVLCRKNGIDSATESTKGTKDCLNGFFFAVYVFFVAKNPFGEGGYRSVTLGNGNVLAEDLHFPPFAALSDQDVSGGTPDTARETHALPPNPNQFDPVRPVATYFDQKIKEGGEIHLYSRINA